MRSELFELLKSWLAEKQKNKKPGDAVLASLVILTWRLIFSELMLYFIFILVGVLFAIFGIKFG
jgi:hypothetical protein